MTPTPREDTMAEQTDQIIERMRTRAMVAGQCSVEAPDNVHSSMAAAEAEFLTECADLLAAQVRERDAAILRYQTAELEQNAVIARLSAQVKEHVQGLEDWIRIAARDAGDATARINASAAEIETLRAERDAAQQQIATLTELAIDTLLLADRARTVAADCLDAEDRAHKLGQALGYDLVAARLSAALQSTRPQEQP